MVWKECFYVGASLRTLCVSDVFGVRVLSDMDTNPIFPQGLLDIFTLKGMRLVSGDSKPV